ncbi:hypothetical protein EDD36DRAFT_500442 [Exophiala viscosa]|uniref:Carboxymuconolactone decarboxylase-like domain-containing protein n=1 Tax=Exophiala viscosa TaxID=2486360 RepID=A0AAN6I8A3_9EURO|nr:hypothetical protein EDD36DRAFT_500442 [Exophiala viscosa]
MALIDTVLTFRDRENEPDPLKASWYLVSAAALAGAGAGSETLPVYRAAIADLPSDAAKLVQRRLKEAILKSTTFVGVPRALGATRDFYASLKDEEIDDYGPRYETYNDPEEQQRRATRGKKFFDVLWTPESAEGIRVAMKKHHPDLYLLNQKLIYEFWAADDRILSNVETELLAIGALITMNCPDQLIWHMKGAIRHGANEQQARLAYELGMAVAKATDCKLSKMPTLDEIDLGNSSFAF